MLFAKKLPPTKQKVQLEMAKARKGIEDKLAPRGPDYSRHIAIPLEGHSAEWIESEMTKMDAEQPGTKWQDGKCSGAVYHGGDDLSKILVSAFARYTVSNPLHPDVFPSIRKMEAEVVAMCLRMYNHPTGAGTTTSGGTESIVMSVKTHRDWARATKGITRPEMIVPESAHAAFDKAAKYFNVKVHHIPVDVHTRQVNLKKVKRAINPNTIMLVGSAVNFPDGCMDDIEALSELAQKHKVGLHVDCCLGSFIVPFLERAGFPCKVFDFRLEGVTAISCDTHKYGFAPKGSSIIMYRSAELREYQYYVYPDWSGGVYASPSLAGSRPGALIAGTWAAMQYMGQDGYTDSCKSIVTAARTIQRAIENEIPELYVLGQPPASVVAFGSSDKSVNVMEVGDAMSRKGWHLSGLNKPPAVHIACTRLTVPVVDRLIADLKDSIHEARSNPSGKGTMMALYGLGSTRVVGPTMVGKVATAFLDTLYLA